MEIYTRHPTHGNKEDIAPVVEPGGRLVLTLVVTPIVLATEGGILKHTEYIFSTNLKGAPLIIMNKARTIFIPIYLETNIHIVEVNIYIY